LLLQVISKRPKDQKTKRPKDQKIDNKSIVTKK